MQTLYFIHADVIFHIIFHYMQTLYFMLYIITCRRYISLHAYVIFHYMQTLYFITCKRYISHYISLHANVIFHVIFHYMLTLFFTLYFITYRRYISLHADVIFHIIFYCTQALIEQTDFLVVGVIGLQGCGKSTILSLLAGNTEADSYRSV